MERGKVFLIANWKMHPETVADARKIFTGMRETAIRAKNVQTVICPPHVFLPELKHLYGGKKISFGAQDVFWETSGSYTGEVSAPQLVSLGAEYVIVGHSERRKLGESDESVNKKVRAALRAGLKVVLCIGEAKRDGQGEYLTFLREEFLSAIEGVNKADLLSVIVAYEPIWAIGKSAKEAMTPEEVHQASIYIRKLLAEKYTPQLAHAVPILYGGSVEPGNTEALLREGHVSGFLVGHASLVSKQFSEMISILNRTGVSL